MSGNLGTMTFRDRGDDMVAAARVYTNKSKGAGATKAQRVQRCKMANLINMFNAFKPLFKRAFESKPKHASDFNMFVKLNLSMSNVLMAKPYVVSGHFVPAFLGDNKPSYYVTRGSLQPIEVSLAENGLTVANVTMPVGATAQNLTVGQLSTALMQAYPLLRIGDQITIMGGLASGIGGSSTSDDVNTNLLVEFDINPEAVETVASVVNSGSIQIGITENALIIGGVNYGCLIASRTSGGTLQVSTARIVCAASVESDNAVFTEADQEAALASYGYQDNVMLTPGQE